jgi:hypothetical protein
MHTILNFDQFVNEAYVPPSGTTGVPVYRGTSFKAEKYIKRGTLLPELQDLLGQVMSGSLKSLTVVAEIPTQGKNVPQYVKDLYAEMGYGSGEDEDSMYDPETDTFKGKRYGGGEEPEVNIFVDSEFVVKDIDMSKNVIIATPFSLRHKNVLIEIDPDKVDEIFIN